MVNRTPLTRPFGDKTGIVGIPECQAVVDAMSAMKAGTVPPGTGDSIDPAQGSDNSAACPQDTQEAACPHGDKDGDVEMGELLMDAEHGPLVDPVLQRAKDMAEAELAHISVHRQEEAFMSDVKARVLQQHKSVVILEAPTSKASVLFNMLKLHTCFPEKFSLWIPVGGRLDLLSAMDAAVTRLFPTRLVFSVVLGQEKQKKNKRSEYALWMPCEGESAPSLIDCSKIVAKSSECLRQRCTIATCPHKETDEVVPMEAPLPLILVTMEVDNMFKICLQLLLPTHPPRTLSNQVT